MKKVIAKVDFTANGELYIKGDELNKLNFEQIVKLNEQGLIEPLEYRDLVLIKRELENKKEVKIKEERL